MNKNILLVSSVLLILGLSCLIYSSVNSSNDKLIVENDVSSKKNVNTNALTMMYETSEGSGEYQIVSDTSWPYEGYTFNTELSKCENGGSLSWNSETKKVVLQTNSSDKCYVY